MVRLITKCSGISALLFHVEHSARQEWFFRWRIQGRYPQAYVQWREGSSCEARQLLQPEIAACVVEAQWRPAAAGAWLPVELRECVPGSASFRVKALEDLSFPQGFRAIAGLSGDLVAAWRFGPLVLVAGIETVIQGVADDSAPDNVLLAAGEFRPCSAVMELENLTLSVGSLVAPSVVDDRLSAIPGSAGRRLFAVARAPFDSLESPVSNPQSPIS